MYIEASIRNYLDDLAAKKPIPGGGSVAALVGALGAGLVSMVANFSLSEEGPEDIKKILEGSEKLRNKLSDLVDRDTEAYQKVSIAYKLPKDDPEQEASRTKAIQDTLKEALAVPLDVSRLTHEGIKLCSELVPKGKVSLISDVGVAAVLLESAFQSALLNVEINLAGLKDEGLIQETRKILEPLIEEMPIKKDAILEETRRRMKS